ncbi:unnamed protein product [Auanema sp. JU1783]|nr:unnamed protein product [Auanema sp. JU1783]
MGTTATPAPTSTIGSSSTLAQTSTATTSASMQSSSISSTAQTSTQPSLTTSGCPPVICEGDIAVSYELLKTSSPKYVYNLRANGRKSAMIILGDLTSEIDSAVDSVNTLKTAGFSIFTISDSPDFAKLATNSSYYFPFVQDPTGIAQTIADSFCTPNPCYSTTSQMTTSSQTTTETLAVPSPSTTVQTSTAGTTPTTAQTSTLGTTATTGQTSTLGTTATTAQTSTIGTSPTTVQTSTMGSSSTLVQTSTIGSTLTSTSPSLMSTTPCVVVTTSTLASTTATMPSPTSDPVCPGGACVYNGDISILYEQTSLEKQDEITSYVAAIASSLYFSIGGATRITVIPYPFSVSYYPPPDWTAVKTLAGLNSTLEIYELSWDDSATDPDMSSAMNYLYQNLTQTSRPLRTATIIGYNNQDVGTDVTTQAKKSLTDSGYKIYTISLDGQGGLSSLASERNFDATSLDQVKTAADQIALSGIPSACCPTLTSITAFRPETSQYSSKSAFGNKQSMEYCKSICNLIQ